MADRKIPRVGWNVEMKQAHEMGQMESGSQAYKMFPCVKFKP
jgi:hypothetical protein